MKKVSSHSYAISDTLHDHLCRVASRNRMSTSKLLSIALIYGLECLNNGIESPESEVEFIRIYADRIKGKDRT